VPYLSASAVVIHYDEALYQVYGPLSLMPPSYRGGCVIIRLMWYQDDQSETRGKKPSRYRGKHSEK